MEQYFTKKYDIPFESLISLNVLISVLTFKLTLTEIFCVTYLLYWLLDGQIQWMQVWWYSFKISTSV